MFNSFPQQQGINAELQLAGYLECVEDQSGQAVEQACVRYRRGDVAGHDARFLPSSAQFTAEVRKTQARINYDARPKIPPPPDHVPTSPRVARWKMQAWLDFLAGNLSWDEFHRKIDRKAAAE